MKNSVLFFCKSLKGSSTNALFLGLPKGICFFTFFVARNHSIFHFCKAISVNFVRHDGKRIVGTN